MTQRREFLQAGLAVSALPLVSPMLGHAATWSGEALAASPAIPLYKIVFDDSLPETGAFAQQVARLGLQATPFTKDITDLWYRELDMAWRQQPLAIAGLTDFYALFVLERLAWDRGMRVLFRAEHRYGSANGIEHVLSGSQPMVDAAVRLSDAGADWPVLMANVVSRCAADCTTSATKRIIAAWQQPTADEPLYSWVIGPRQHA